MGGAAHIRASLPPERPRRGSGAAPVAAARAEPSNRALRPLQPGRTTVPTVQRIALHENPFEDDVETGPAADGETVQRLAGSGPAPATVASDAVVPSGGGRPLDPRTRAFMEPRFDRDLGDVRIHADAAAGRRCAALDARAFALGSDLHFGEGEFRPDSTDGLWTLAHELAHVVQQTGPAPLGVQRLSAPGAATRHNVYPWGRGAGISGSNYEAQTDGGASVPAWIAYSPFRTQYQYWCHGLSFGTYAAHGYSIYSGSPVRSALADEYRPVHPTAARPGDIAVWTERHDHSAVLTSIARAGTSLDPDRTRMETKNGSTAQKNDSLTGLQAVYPGTPDLFRKK